MVEPLVIDSIFILQVRDRLGKNVYNIINLTQDDAIGLRTAWTGSFTLTARVRKFL